ncbi:ATP-dependent RNA helicase HrpA [Patulibacter defluvii]|uniref:ATP-dependent RNA helicase HrpA n=1 Tax=Patulibacter defluvii TaxID=3095358 RepID=UPI002A761189|nr:ATP-dependent RNA helicase HrpA [Patulibacter sp. DM4]
MADAVTTPDLRERLRTLSLRDEHRLARRVDRLRHQRDDGARARELAKLLPELERAEARVAARRAAVPAVSYPEELPVSARRDDLLAAIRDHQVVVVAGETGSGKTTQLPKICLELGRGVRGTIAHTQPRRIAARTVAERIADELDVELGGAIGYSVRFNDRASETTLVRLMTDGLLLAEIQRDRLLRRYDTIIIDEAHERSLNIDFLLGCVKQILPKRPELKVVITSATIDPERFSAHFDDAPIVEVSGRTYPVEVRYRPIEDPDADSDDPDDDDRRRPRPGNRARGAAGDRDQAEAIGDAVEELLAHHRRTHGASERGDVLVFLSGEREIRDAAEALAGRFGTPRPGQQPIEILPLYARLAASEQQRVFRLERGGRTRVVLATNVAETSLTVPGIKYVIDPGTARISRYSPRLKVQRLPIERISQASADQRKGRCGRTSDGICIRLYSEDDFAGRPEFTDPEILRTNLASVILQMAALELGAIERFPFLEPPDGRQVRDGVLLLEELGALTAGRATKAQRADEPAARLTPLGRKLANLPVDPRMARMVLEADRLGCTDEVIVIAAALSIQDPRERPADEQAAADQAHARFKDERSDFLAYLHLWRYLRTQQRALSGNQFRKRSKAEFLHYLRIREWQDLVAQLRQAAKQVGVTVPHDRRADAPAADDEPLGAAHAEDRLAAADAERIHLALLSGLLSHVGLKESEPAKGRPKGPKGRPPRPEYVGARGARFQLFPGSALSRKPPTWTMVAELVETSRLFGRTAARIEPGWIEPLAEHLIVRTHAEPRWDRKRGSVVATERALLYGLPVVAGRTVQYGRIDPVASRGIFLRSALVEGDWDGGRAGGAEILAENARRIAEVEALEERVRRRDLLVDDEVLYAFLDERLPEAIVGGVEFDRWWREERQRRPELLVYPRELLVRDAPDDERDEARLRPTAWKQGEITLPLSYRFEPGSEHDGVTVHVPLKVLPQLQPIGFEWLVPGLRPELVTTLLRLLPKEVRRELVPIPETAQRLLERMTPRSAPLPVALARELNAGPWHPPTRVTPAMLDPARLPSHLRMSFRIEDDEQDPPALVAEGHDLAALRAAVQPKLRAALAAATPSIERAGLRDWIFGALPRTVALPGTGGTVRAHPALVDEGDSVAVRVLDGEAAQADAMWRGTRRLLLLTIPSPARQLPKTLDQRAQLVLATAPHGSVDALLEDVVVATVDGLLAFAGGPVWDQEAFAALRADVAGRLPTAAPKVLQQVVRIVDAERDVRRRLEDLSLAAAGTASEAAFADALRDVEAQLRGLVHPGFATAAGPRRLPDVLRYLRGIERRLERLPDTVARDHDRMQAIRELEAAYRARRDGWPAGAPRPAALDEVRWMIEELRLAQFAQGFAGGRGGDGPVSAKRIRRLLDEVGRAPGAGL